MKIQCDISLPASKSESNRALMIAAYGGFSPDFQNLSESLDTFVLKEALAKSFAQPLLDSNRTTLSRNDIKVCAKEDDEPAVHVIPCGGGGHGIYAQQINVKDCGTATRFLTTFMACREGDWLLTGSERMKQRPISPLVDSLLQLGADIHYVEKEGFLPLRIAGKAISGGRVSVDMTQSSQFASSLLLAAPMWQEGLELDLLGELNSVPYLDMTLAMMRHFGAVVSRIGRQVMVKPKPYQSRSFAVSADWTAASYWYEMAALSEECEIKLRFLSLPKGRLNMQGDAIISDWMKMLGVNTLPDDDAVILTKNPGGRQSFSFDCSNNPDLFPTMVATCAGLQLAARFTGVANLHYKESDRVEAMKVELAKIGTDLLRVNDNEVVLKPAVRLPFFEKSSPLRFASHGDHRMVMALAPLALRLGHVVFDRPEVVEKSYPNFWSDARFLL
ncbi:MAG: hypothetical protein IJ622_10565 [Bacteroidales bacterium]|nr:hypothetical protein [Bacteroidales bacterium]